MLETKEIEIFKDNTEIEMYGILNRVETALQNTKKAEVSEHGFFDEYAFNEKITYHENLNAELEEEKPNFALKSWVDEDTDKTENIYALLTEDYDPLAELTFDTADNGYKIKPVVEIFSEKSSPIVASQPLVEPSINEISFIEDFEISVSEEPLPTAASQPTEEVFPTTANQPTVEKPVTEEPLPATNSRQPNVEVRPVTEEALPATNCQPAVEKPVTEEALPATNCQPAVEKPVTEEPLPVTNSQQPNVEARPTSEEALPATANQPTVEVRPTTEEVFPTATSQQAIVEVTPTSEEALPVTNCQQPTVEVRPTSEEALSATNSQQPIVETKKGFTVADLKIEETEKYLDKKQSADRIGTLTAKALRDADFIATNDKNLSTENLNLIKTEVISPPSIDKTSIDKISIDKTLKDENIDIEPKLSLEENTIGEPRLNSVKKENDFFLRLLDRKPKVVAKNIELSPIIKGTIETKEKYYDDKEINVLDFSTLEPEAALHLLTDDFTKELEKNYIEARNNELDKIAAEEKEQVKREAKLNGEINKVAEIEKLISKQIIGLLEDDLALAPLLNKIEKAVEIGVLNAFKKIMKNLTFKNDDD